MKKWLRSLIQPVITKNLSKVILFIKLLRKYNYNLIIFFIFCINFYSESRWILHQLSFILYQLFYSASRINFFYSVSTFFILHLVQRILHQLYLFCINFFYSASHPKNLASTFFIQHLVPKTLDLVSRINFFVDFEKNSVSQIIAD